MEFAGASVVFVALDGGPGGLIAVADPIKPTTQDAIRQLMLQNQQAKEEESSDENEQ
ncbi:hypothetical protein D3C83_165520 [compost metagenome]